MDSATQDYYVQWIISDYTPFDFEGKSYYLSSPSREARFLAERHFLLVYANAQDEGSLDEMGIANLLRKFNIWSLEKQATLDALTKDIEEIKLNLYEHFNNKAKRTSIRKALRDTEEYIGKLLLEKQSLDTYGSKAAATLAKQHYLVGSSIYRQVSKKPLLKGNWWSLRDDSIIQYAYEVLSDYILTDTQYRELARCTTWRNIWSSRKGSNLFGRAAVDLSPQQRQLTLWSNMYDNIYKNSECPSDAIVEDDDALDGWMIKQRRKRDKELNKNRVEGMLSDKTRNADQVYVFCDEEGIEPSAVYDCNDSVGKMRIQSIERQIKERGTVRHMELKDTQVMLMNKINK